MMKTTPLKWLLVAMFTTVTLCVEAQTPTPLQVKETTLSNGMTVWLNEDHSQPKIYGAVVVNAGAKDCPNTGIAHYFEHIMFKGTEEIGTVDYAAEKPWLDSISACYDRLAATSDEATRSSIQKDINRLSQRAGEYAIPNEFNRLISLYGGSNLNAGTSWDFTFYHNSFTPQYIEQWCLLNSDRLINPVFRLFQGELETVYEEKNRASDNMMDEARNHILSELFGTQPYAYPIIGSTENLKNPKQSDMRDFYTKYYVGCNMGLVLCGDFQSDSIMPLLERTFGRIPRGVAPTRVKSPLADFTAERTVKVKIPIPLISLEALVFKSPTTFERDANAMDIATKILFNEKAGMLDSLSNEGKLMMAASMPISLNDAGITILLLVPNPLASTKKAEAACLEQMKRLSSGDFSDELFTTQRQSFYSETFRGLETIDKRAMQMVEVMASGHKWQDYIDKVNAINKVTKADVMSAAKHYLEAPFLRFKKKFGQYEKDKVTQPGYTPVVPKNKNAESAYARRLASLPVEEHEPRLLDLEKDVTTTSLGQYSTLYTVKNPVNDLFELELCYNRGEQADPRLAATSGLLNYIGTDSLTRQKFGSALQSLGADLSIESSQSMFTITISGTDQHFEETIQLIGHLLTNPKSNKSALKKVQNAKKAEFKEEKKDNKEMLGAMINKVLYGDKSNLLNRLSVAETKKLSGEELLSALDAVFASTCYVSYSGTLPTSDVASIVSKHLPVSRSTQPFVDYSIDVINYNEPIVYLYDMPKARQTLFFTYDQVKALPTQESRVPFRVFNEYFGGGMSSVLFQEVREFRSLAYTTQSTTRGRSRIRHPQSPLGFLTFVGTQSDKTMGAIALVDSLLHNMTVNENNFITAKRSLINEIDTEFPSFREIGSNIAVLRQHGWTSDPNTGSASLIENATMEDMKSFFDSNISNNANHRVLGIVGNMGKLDMSTLSKYGKIVVLKAEDLIKH